MARMLRKQRSGRAARLPQNIWTREKGPLVLSVMNGFRLSHSSIREFTGSKIASKELRTAFLHGSYPYATKNISRMLSFAHESGKPCGKNWKSPSNSTNFNAMMRFALFLCNRLAPSLPSCHSSWKFCVQCEQPLGHAPLSHPRISNTTSVAVPSESSPLASAR